MFEKNFMLGAATAAHQVEGNNVNSDCWALEHIAHSSYDEPSGAAVDHYHHFREDIDLLAEAGLNSYRFSLEWARIEPQEGSFDEAEIEHYRQVLRYCHEKNVIPIVTMHHFSSPKWLTADGGWENPEVTGRFAAYCTRMAAELGDLMEYVCTINEANMRLQLSALIRDMMKKMQNAGEGNVQVGFNAMQENMKLAMAETAAAFRVADPRQVHPFVSECTPEGDLLVMKAHEAARDAMKAKCPHLKIGLTLSLHDIQHAEGGEERAKEEWNNEFVHYLPYIQNDDFLGVQCYTRKVFGADGIVQPDDGMKLTQMGYEDDPVAIANVVCTVAKDFHKDLIVTENGIATADDERRCEFITQALQSLQQCIVKGIPLKGYMYWSLLDNFEWQKGFAKTFGLIAVDRNTMERHPKKSLKVLGEFG